MAESDPQASLPTSPEAAKVEGAREVRDEVAKLLDGTSLHRKTKAFKDCGPGNDVARTLATDAKGRTRFYARSTGTDDASLSFSYYYDAKSRLRWVDISGASSEGSLLEAHVGFGEDGARIFEEHKTVAGPAYKFPEKWPEADLKVSAPKKLFAAKNVCGPPIDPSKPVPAATPGPAAPAHPHAHPHAEKTAAPAKTSAPAKTPAATTPR